MITNDSKGLSKAIAALIQQHYPEKRLLVINSETSGGQAERDFLKAPHLALMGADGADYDVIIASPSMATGISIEALGVITKVFGVFMGASASDRDMTGCDLYLIEPYCVSVLAFSNAVHNFWRDSMRAILGNAFIAIKEYQMKVAPV